MRMGRRRPAGFDKRVVGELIRLPGPRSQKASRCNAITQARKTDKQERQRKNVHVLFETAIVPAGCNNGRTCCRRHTQ